MNDINQQTMQFQFADRELILQVADLLAASVDVIVNPANGGLSHGGGVAGLISQQGGEQVQQESNQFIKEHGILESGMVAITSAGHLPYEAIIHAVGPRMGEGDEQHKIEQAVSRSLQLCSMHDWHAIAFPAISTGIFGVPVDVAAKAFYRAITSFWDARHETEPGKIIICLTEKNFEAFFHAFRDASICHDTELQPPVMNINSREEEHELPDAGIVNLSEDDISGLNDDEVNEWFK